MRNSANFRLRSIEFQKNTRQGTPQHGISQILKKEAEKSRVAAHRLLEQRREVPLLDLARESVALRDLQQETKYPARVDRRSGIPAP